MKFKELVSIKEVESVSLAERIVFKAKTGGLHYLTKDGGFSKIIESVYDYKAVKDEIYFQEENLKKLSRFKANCEAIEILDGEFSLRGAFLINENVIYVLGKNHGKKSIWIIDRKSLKVRDVVEYTTFPFLNVDEKKEIFKRNNYILCTNLLTEEVFWSYQLPENEKLIGEMYFHKGVLVFATMEGEVNEDKIFLYGVDVNTGKLLYKREGAFHYYQKQPETGFLFGFGHGFYEVTNPITGEKIVEKKLTDELWVSQHMNFLGPDGLYFIGGNHTNMGMFISKFGKINIETHQIDFVQNLDVKEGVKADAPIYYEGKLYIKDSENVLHIYENT